MLRPLRQWICDVCGELVASPADGLLEWRVEERAGGTPRTLLSGFRLVHAEGCRAADCPAAALTRYTGRGGFARLLTFLDPPLAADAGGAAHGVASPREYAELLRRLYVPYYEEARQYWVAAMRDCAPGDAAAVAALAPEALQALVERHAEREPLAPPGADPLGAVALRW